jgi:hypothetical protein
MVLLLLVFVAMVFNLSSLQKHTAYICCQQFCSSEAAGHFCISFGLKYVDGTRRRSISTQQFYIAGTILWS